MTEVNPVVRAQIEQHAQQRDALPKLADQAETFLQAFQKAGEKLPAAQREQAQATAETLHKTASSQEWLTGVLLYEDPSASAGIQRALDSAQMLHDALNGKRPIKPVSA